MYLNVFYHLSSLYQGEQLTMIKIKELLSKMPNLRHFELDTEGSRDLIDGQQWELLVSHLTVFDFRIHLNGFITSSNEPILQSFRSLFWLEQKRWFVANDGSYIHHIFTIPRFVSSIVKYPYTNWPPSSTSSDFSFNPYIKTCYMSLFNPALHCFTNITSLVFDMNEISTDSGFCAFVHRMNQLPLLHSVTFRDLSVLSNVPNNVVFKKIRSLDVLDTDTRANVRIPLNIDRLCTIFPCLERLTMGLTSNNDFVSLIDRLPYLSIVKFELTHFALVTRRWLTKKSRRLGADNNFTCKIIHNRIHLWMNNERVC